MKQIVQNYKTGKLEIAEVPVPTIMPGRILVKNAFSLISAGTERSSVELARKNLLAKAKSRPADMKKVLALAKKQGFLSAYKTAMARLDTPTPLGYSSAGTVIQIGKDISSIKAGDRVACAGAGYANHSEVILVPENLCAVVPENVPLEWAAFTTLASIALQGVRQADIKLGESVAVIGLGLLGQLTVQILKASGCRVIGIDLDQDKIELAKKSGVDKAILRSGHPEKVIFQFTDGRGVDAVIITAATSSNDPFLLAPKIARDRAKVVLVGVAKIDFSRESYYRKEISVIFSRSYGPGRYDTIYEEKGIDYPIGYVRWTEKRNMEAVLQLMSEKKLNIEPLISHRFKIEQAKEAYDLILGKKKEKFLGVLFEYDTSKEYVTKIMVSDTSEIRKIRSSKSEITIGFIGVGSFAQTSLLPHFKRTSAKLVGVADAQAHIVRHIGTKYGFNYCTSDYKEILNDKSINTIFIATRHNLHSRLIIESLKAGKNVYCEKPLCVNRKELQQIIKVHNDQITGGSMTPLVMIGFNRRFSPLTIMAKKFLKEKIGPYYINYRVNAGVLPSDHWLFDPEQGGGRIIGEVCHFIDLIRAFIQAPLIQVYAQPITGPKESTKDNAVISLKYQDGSAGTISYFAVGDKDFAKERIEIFGDQEVCIIDDFKKLLFSEDGKTKEIKQNQDKGYANEIRAFFDAIRNGGTSPIPFSEIIETTLATFAINESLQREKPVNIPRISSQ